MKITKFADNLYILDNDRVREFLITGKDKAVLIDTGFPEDNIKEEISRITDKPVTVILTHSHPDHTGGIDSFDDCYIHKNEIQYIKNKKVKTIEEGTIISAGGYNFEIILLPGHTRGSIALLDKDKKLLISGDSIQTGPIFMFDEQSDINTLIKSTEYIKDNYIDYIETILPSHNKYPLTKEYIDYCIEDDKALAADRLSGAEHPFLPCKHYKGKHIEYFYRKK